MLDTSDALFQSALQAFRKAWGHETFRPAQEQAIRAVLAGEDVLAVLSTGYGKSSCFQVPALVLPGCVLVISPLIALMKDQVGDCEKRGIPASYVNSHVDRDEVEERYANLIAGAYKVFYVAPERLDTKSFLEAIHLAEISLLAVDECHSISVWGSDFRPAYSRIKDILPHITLEGRRPPVLGVTATATRDIEDDIARGLNMTSGYTRIIGDPTRANLSYEVLHGNAERLFISTIRDLDIANGRHIVYAGSRKLAERLCDLIKTNISDSSLVGFYHAGVNREGREEAQDAFKGGVLRIVVATSAFGMGIDVPDIRTVIHYGIPGSVEDYTQQAGRAGRDGKPSRVVLISDQRAYETQMWLLDQNNPPLEVYPRLWAWLLRNTQPGESIHRSGVDIAEDMCRTGPKITGDQVNAALQIMDAAQIIKRTASGSRTPFWTMVSKERALAGVKRPEAQMLVEKLWREAPDGSFVYYDKNVLAKNLRTSVAVLDAILRPMRNAKLLNTGETFVGKTTLVTKRDVSLDKSLPMGDLKAKRDRELHRLAQMEAYTRTTDRVGFIRRYFMEA